MREQVILLDVEVQKDFFQPGGALYNRANNRVTANIYRLFDWARATGSFVVSSVLLVRPGQRGPLSDVPHCVEGTGGEAKLARTLLTRRINLGLGHNMDLPGDLMQTYQQVIFEKRDPDIFRHVRAERLITELPPGLTFVVCGAGVAHGIKQAVVGLRSRGHSVLVAEDAVLDLAAPAAEMAWLQMVAKAARPMSTAQIFHDLAPVRRRQAGRTVRR